MDLREKFSYTNLMILQPHKVAGTLKTSLFVRLLMIFPPWVRRVQNKKYLSIYSIYKIITIIEPYE